MPFCERSVLSLPPPAFPPRVHSVVDATEWWQGTVGGFVRGSQTLLDRERERGGIDYKTRYAKCVMNAFGDACPGSDVRLHD